MYLKRLTVGVASMLMATSLLAFPPEGGRMSSDDKCSPYYGIELSDAQKSEITQLQSEMRSAMDSIRDSSTFPLAAALQTGVFDSDAYLNAAKEPFEESVRLHAHYDMLIYNVLTGDQKETFISNLNNRPDPESCRPPRPDEK